MTNYSVWGLGGLGACLLLACGGTVSLREGSSLVTGGTAASAGGAGGTTQATNVGGASETPPALDPCLEGLDELCGAQPCPASAAELLDRCADAESLTSAPTSCGGTVVSIFYGYGAISWFFDANGSLAGATSSDDMKRECSDGHVSFNSIYGAICPQQGEARGICPPADGCAPPPLVCDGGQYCPPTPDDVLGTYCSSTSTLGVTTTPTTCGGSILLVESSTGDFRYCFDSRNRLVGTVSRPSATGVSTPSGSDCIADGTPTYACDDNPQ